MESRDQNVLTPGRDDPTIYLAHNFYPRPHVLEERRPDENPDEGLLEALYLELLLEGMDLSAETIALDEGVHQPEQRLPRPRRRRRGQYPPRARPPNGAPLVADAADAVQEPRLGHYLPDGRRLSPWHDQTGQPVEVFEGP